MLILEMRESRIVARREENRRIRRFAPTGGRRGAVGAAAAKLEPVDGRQHRRGTAGYRKICYYLL